MRRPSLSVLLTLPVLAALTACGSAVNVPEMDPEEVLQRSATASRTMQSAQFTGNFTLNLDMTDSWTAYTAAGNIAGVLQDSGNDVTFALTEGVLRRQSEDDPFAMTVDVSLTAFVPGDVYVRLDSLLMEEGEAVLSPELLQNLLGKWWRLPSDSEQPDTVAVTPDPGLLRAQAEVVRVTENKGVTTIDGAPSYKYAVAVDQEKLVAFLRTAAEEQGEPFKEAGVREALASTTIEGELSIDAETFFVRRLLWTITRKGTEEQPGNLALSFTLTFSNHNKAPEIAPPENAEIFSPLLFLGTSPALPSLDQLPVPQQDQAADPFAQMEGMTPEEQQFLLQMMESGTLPTPVQ
jgi:hypothetical protein